MKIGAEKKVVPNMNGVPNAAYVNNQSRTYQGQPYRAQQPMGNVSGQHVQQGNPQMQYQQMAGNTSRDIGKCQISIQRNTNSRSISKHNIRQRQIAHGTNKQ